MEKRARILMKLAVVAVLTLLFIWLIYTDEKVLQLIQPEGEGVSTKDVLVLLTEMKEAGADGIDGEVLGRFRRLFGRRRTSCSIGIIWKYWRFCQRTAGLPGRENR